jgi:hypothetical protein
MINSGDFNPSGRQVLICMCKRHLVRNLETHTPDANRLMLKGMRFDANILQQDAVMRIIIRQESVNLACPLHHFHPQIPDIECHRPIQVPDPEMHAAQFDSIFRPIKSAYHASFIQPP